MSLVILQGDVRDVLPTLESGSVQCCVTSPPYWRLRDYGVAGQIGQEKTPEEFVQTMVQVFREVRRVLKEDGTCWVNLGDSYASNPSWGRGGGSTLDGRKQGREGGKSVDRTKLEGLKPKDLVGIPWRVALALQADGWWLRQDIIWHKPNPMPESVTDRCTKAHEYIFLLTKSERYFYDAEAILEPSSPGTHARLAQNVAAQVGSARANGGAKTNGNMKAVGRSSWNGSRFDKGKTDVHQGRKAQRHEDRGVKNNGSFDEAMAVMPEMRNKRSVWTVPTYGVKEAHFATFPPDLIKPCILAGSRPGDVVLDCFGGSGTTGMVARELARKAVLVELNPEYAAMAERRCDITPGLALTTGGSQ